MLSLYLCYFIILISPHEVRPYFFTHHRLCENPLKMGEVRRGAIICWHPNPHLQLIGGREHTKYIRWINFKSNIGHRDKTIRYTINLDFATCLKITKMCYFFPHGFIRLSIIQFPQVPYESKQGCWWWWCGGGARH